MVEYLWQAVKIGKFYLKIIPLSSRGKQGEKTVSGSKRDFPWLAV